MLDPGSADTLSRSGMAHRAHPAEDGTVIYRLADGSHHVRIAARDWRFLQEEFAARVKPLRRRANIATVLLLPGILLFGMTLAHLLPGGGAMILAAMFGGPIAIYLRYSHQVQRVSRSIEARLATCPAAEPPARDPRRVPRWVDIALALLVGPGLLVAIVGEIGGPDIFRGTPWWGSGIGATEFVGLALLVLRFAWPRLAGYGRAATA